jgi:regulator of sigma E protease
MSTTLLVEIAQFVGALAALIIIHELGHFIVARLLKVEVEEFGIGFPPRVVTLFHAWGTRFSLNLLPFGGFVRPKGENDPSVPGGLAASSPWVRLSVLLAGPVANLLVGVALYALIFTKIGMPITDQVQIMEVAINSPSAQAGLLPGDLILAVNDSKINSTEALHDAIYAALDQPTRITFLRNEQEGETTLVPRSQPPEGEGAIGIVMGNPTKSVSLTALPVGFYEMFEHGRELLAFPVRMIKGRLLGGVVAW